MMYATSRRTLLSMLALGGALLSAGCQPKAAQGPSVSNAWAPATPPGATVAATYLEITTGAADTLLGATAPVAAQIEMHTTSEDGGMMRMRQLETVELEPGRPVAFQPGGTHFMLVGLNAPLVAGSGFPLTLRFRNAGDLVIDVTVAAPGAGHP